MEVDKFIRDLLEEVYSRLYDIGMKGRIVILKLMVRREDVFLEMVKFMGM